jgi:riboflavin kinase / FMN adenylyltransferase
MRIIRNLDSNIRFSKPVLTLGTFDGVHLGHQEILKNLVQHAKKNGKESVLFTFDPHPRIVLDPVNHSVKLIDTLNERLKKLELTGLDTVILFPFTKEFSQLSAREFVEQILVDKLNVSEMFVGYDHHFGKNRSGNFEELKHLGEEFNFQVSQIEAVQLERDSVSSTKIRKALSEGNTTHAMSYLGVPYQFSGEIIKGNQLGRTIGFPTANVLVKEETKIIPAHGVYAVRVELNGVWHCGVMNIGTKPTVQDSLKTNLEVFIFDFSADIYGEELHVLVYDFIRSEQRFASLEELKTQLKKDEETARALLLKY